MPLRQLRVKCVRSNRGLTLIEMIASLAIVAILAAIAGVGIVQITRGFLLARDTSEVAQKAQLAMARMVKEFSHITDVAGGSSRTLQFSAYHADDPATPEREFVLAWDGTSGSPLWLTSRTPAEDMTDILVDNVVLFDLSYVYYDLGGILTTSSAPTALWEAARVDPARQAAIRVRLQLVRTDYEELSTIVYLGKHD